MSDLISRQAILNALEEHRALFCDNTPDTFSKLSYAEKSRVDEIDTAIATIVNLPSVENKGEWIPVSERLPKAFETVLRTRIENGWNGTTYTMVDTGCICPIDHNIVAWMPLPEPYKGESEDKECTKAQ